MLAYTNPKFRAEMFVFSFNAFLLNYVWESWHAIYLYEGYGQFAFSDSIKQYLFVILHVATMDLAMLIAIVLIGGLIFRDWLWFETYSRESISYWIIATLGLALSVEIKGVYLLHQWSYLPAMPTLAGIGLSPLVQLLVTGSLALLMVRTYRVLGNHKSEYLT